MLRRGCKPLTRETGAYYGASDGRADELTHQ